MQKELLHGTLEVMILKGLSSGRNHGFGIGKWIERLSDGALRIEEGSLYPALYRLERKGWIESEWSLSENNRRAKYHALTAEGHRQLRAAQSQWSEFAAAVGRVLSGPAPAGP